MVSNAEDIAEQLKGFAVLWSRTTLAGPKQSQWLALPNSAAASYLQWETTFRNLKRRHVTLPNL